MSLPAWCALVTASLLGSALLVTSLPRLAARWHSAPEPPLPPLPRRIKFPPEPVHLTGEEQRIFWETAWDLAMHRREGGVGVSAYTVTRNTLAIIGAATVASVAFLASQAIAAEYRMRAMERKHRQMTADYMIHRLETGQAVPDPAAGAGDSTDRGRSASAPAPVADQGEWWEG